MKKKTKEKIWATVTVITNREGKKEGLPLTVVALNKHFALKAVQEKLRERMHVDENGDLLPYRMVGFHQLSPDEAEHFSEGMTEILDEFYEFTD